MKRTLFLCGVVILIVSSSVFADEGEVTMKDLMEEIQYLKDRVKELEGKAARQEVTLKKQEQEVKETKSAFMKYEPGEGISIEPTGPSISAGATIVTQMALDPNTANDASEDNDVTDASYSIDIEVEQEVGESGLAYLHLEGGDGPGLDGDEITTFSAVNRDAADTNNRVEITEVWYEHYFLDKMITLRGGKLDPTIALDTNAIANDECTQFLSATFRNSSVLEFPDDNTYGIWTNLEPFEWMALEGGIYDDNADWEDPFRDMFTYAQLNIKPALFSREGNYRTYFWYDDSNHTKWADPGTTTQPNFGFGTSCDQKIFDYLTWFGRWGWEDPDVSVVEWAWSTGLQVDGTQWGRDNDYLGVAVGMDIASGDYEDAGNPGDAEGHVELYYNFRLNDNVSISPDYQLVWNPNGEDRDPISIFGLRSQIDF